jgi:hypothetical protein
VFVPLFPYSLLISSVGFLCFFSIRDVLVGVILALYTLFVDAALIVNLFSIFLLDFYAALLRSIN